MHVILPASVCNERELIIGRLSVFSFSASNPSLFPLLGLPSPHLLQLTETMSPSPWLSTSLMNSPGFDHLLQTGNRCLFCLLLPQLLRSLEFFHRVQRDVKHGMLFLRWPWGCGLFYWCGTHLLLLCKESQMLGTRTVDHKQEAPSLVRCIVLSPPLPKPQFSQKS